MFLGTYEPKLDDKGRMFLPARFREDMQGGIVLTRGQEHCIYAFPAAEFESMTEELRRAPLTSKQARDWIRVMLSGAYKEVPDRDALASRQICVRTPVWIANSPSSARDREQKYGMPRPGASISRSRRRCSPIQQKKLSPGCSDPYSEVSARCSDITSPMAEHGGGPGWTDQTRASVEGGAT